MRSYFSYTPGPRWYVCYLMLEQCVNTLVLGTRELVVRELPYVIPYRVRDNHIEILRVLHTSQSRPGKLSWA